MLCARTRPPGQMAGDYACVWVGVKRGDVGVVALGPLDAMEPSRIPLGG